MIAGMTYREVLYRDYSATFGGGKAYDARQQWAAYESIYRGIIPSDTGLSVADLGCGKGEWLGWMGSRGFGNRCGVDLSPADLAVARQHDPGVRWVEGGLMDVLESHPGAFDVLHAKDVVEHMTKDEFIAFLRVSLRALRAGGRLWLLTYNAQSPLAGMTRYGDFTHEIGFTPASMAQCLRACGFDQPQVRGFHYCARSTGGRMRRLAGMALYGASRFLLKVRHGGAASMHGVDQFNAQPDLFAVAQKS